MNRTQLQHLLTQCQRGAPLCCLRTGADHLLKSNIQDVLRAEHQMGSMLHIRSPYNYTLLLLNTRMDVLARWSILQPTPKLINTLVGGAVPSSCSHVTFKNLIHHLIKDNSALIHHDADCSAMMNQSNMITSSAIMQHTLPKLVNASYDNVYGHPVQYYPPHQVLLHLKASCNGPAGHELYLPQTYIELSKLQAGSVGVESTASCLPSTAVYRPHHEPFQFQAAGRGADHERPPVLYLPHEEILHLQAGGKGPAGHYLPHHDLLQLQAGCGVSDWRSTQYLPCRETLSLQAGGDGPPAQYVPEQEPLHQLQASHGPSVQYNLPIHEHLHLQAGEWELGASRRSRVGYLSRNELLQLQAGSLRRDHGAQPSGVYCLPHHEPLHLKTGRRGDEMPPLQYLQHQDLSRLRAGHHGPPAQYLIPQKETLHMQAGHGLSLQRLPNQEHFHRPASGGEGGHGPPAVENLPHRLSLLHLGYQAGGRDGAQPSAALECRPHQEFLHPQAGCTDSEQVTNSNIDCVLEVGDSGRSSLNQQNSVTNSILFSQLQPEANLQEEYTNQPDQHLQQNISQTYGFHIESEHLFQLALVGFATCMTIIFQSDPLPSRPAFICICVSVVATLFHMVLHFALAHRAYINNTSLISALLLCRLLSILGAVVAILLATFFIVHRTMKKNQY